MPANPVATRGAVDRMSAAIDADEDQALSSLRHAEMEAEMRRRAEQGAAR